MCALTRSFCNEYICFTHEVIWSITIKNLTKAKFQHFSYTRIFKQMVTSKLKKLISKSHQNKTITFHYIKIFTIQQSNKLNTLNVIKGTQLIKFHMNNQHTIRINFSFHTWLYTLLVQLLQYFHQIWTSNINTET